MSSIDGNSLQGTDPQQFNVNFAASFSTALLTNDAEAGQMVNGFHTSDIIPVAGGFRIDRSGRISSR